MDGTQTTAEIPRTGERPPRGPNPPRRPPRSRSKARGRRRLIVGGAVLVAVIAGVAMLRSGLSDPPPEDIPGTPAWAVENYGNPEKSGFKRRNIVEIEFLGRAMFVHRGASRHFLRLERLFEARAPDYAAAVALGELDDWSYENRDVRGEDVKSTHAFGVAVDVNALANPLGTTGDMPEEVVRQWEAEGGEWGGDWSRSDPMHFETHLTPKEIRARYRPDGTPRDWYLEELVGD
jgi:D-alanyl-D-alanine carboxypeptidase